MQGDFRLGVWLIRPQLNRIEGTGGHASCVEPKALEVLAYLAKHSGEVLAKERIIRAVWPDTLVTDDVLARASPVARLAASSITASSSEGCPFRLGTRGWAVLESRPSPRQRRSGRGWCGRESELSSRAQDWHDQAERDLQHARMDSREDFHEWACFSAQQAAERALKALFQHLNAEVWGHSVKGLLENLPAECGAGEELVDCGRILDRFYIPTRYPNGFDDGKPGDYYTAADSEQAVGCAEKILSFCKSRLSR